MQQQALSVIVAWLRLERALEAFNADLRRDYGITSLQLAILRILSERAALPLAALRKTLVMHPATLGQAIDHLRGMDLCIVRPDPNDRRARTVAITELGRALVAEAPLAGPVRLRLVEEDPYRLEALALSLEDAAALFGLTPWLPSPRRSTR
jgi:DNA-binding MarR family transcriptional regulator